MFQVHILDLNASNASELFHILDLNASNASELFHILDLGTAAAAAVSQELWNLGGALVQRAQEQNILCGESLTSTSEVRFRTSCLSRVH